MKIAVNTDNLTPHEVASRWKNTISVQTLANWRSNGTGPKFLKVGGRVLYRRTDIEQWEEEQQRTPCASR